MAVVARRAHSVTRRVIAIALISSSRPSPLISTPLAGLPATPLYARRRRPASWRPSHDVRAAAILRSMQKRDGIAPPFAAIFAMPRCPLYFAPMRIARHAAFAARAPRARHEHATSGMSAGGARTSSGCGFTPPIAVYLEYGVDRLVTSSVPSRFSAAVARDGRGDASTSRFPRRFVWLRFVGFLGIIDVLGVGLTVVSPI